MYLTTSFSKCLIPCSGFLLSGLYWLPCQLNHRNLKFKVWSIHQSEQTTFVFWGVNYLTSSFQFQLFSWKFNNFISYSSGRFHCVFVLHFPVHPPVDEHLSWFHFEVMIITVICISPVDPDVEHFLECCLLTDVVFFWQLYVQLHLPFFLFYKLVICQMYGWQIFSKFCRLSLHSVDSFFCCNSFLKNFLNIILF